MSFARVIGVSAVFSFTANKAISQMTRTEQRFRSLGDSATNARQQINEGFSKLNTLGVIATAAAGTAVKKFADFDKSAMRLQSRLEDGDPALQVFKDRALEVAGATKFTAAEVLQGMEMFKQMGVSGADTLKNMGMMAKFAEAENISLEKAIKMGVTSTKAFGMETDDMSRVLNRMMFVAANSAANVNELYNGIRYIGGVTNFTKSNFAELTNILGLFHNNALIGSRSGTVLSNMVNQLSKNAGQGKIQIGKYTAMIHKNAEGGLDITQSILNVATAFRLMQKDALKSGTGMEEVQKVANKLFGMRGSRGVGALLSIVEGKDFQKTVKMYKTGEQEVNKTIDTVYAIRTQNIMDAYIRFTSAVDAFAIASVKAFKGPIYNSLESFSKKIQNASLVVAYLTQNNENLLKTTAEIKKELDPNNKLGISESSIDTMRGFYGASKATLGVAETLGSSFLWVFDKITDITGVIGLGKKELAAFGGFVAAGGVIATGIMAIKFAVGLLLVPIYKVGVGLAVWGFEILAASFGLSGLATAIGLVGMAMKGLKFAAAFYVIYKGWQSIARLFDHFTNGALTKMNDIFGDFLAKFQFLRSTMEAMGLIQMGGTATGPTAQGVGQQKLSTLLNMSQRGVTLQGKDGQRQAITREVATEQVRKSLQNRKYSEPEIAEALKQLAPQLIRFTAQEDLRWQDLKISSSASVGPVQFHINMDGRKVAEGVAKVQNDQLERTGQKVDRRNAMVGIPTPIKGSKR